MEGRGRRGTSGQQGGGGGRGQLGECETGGNLFFFRNKKRRQSITSAGLRALVYTVLPIDTVELVRRILSFLL